MFIVMNLIVAIGLYCAGVFEARWAVSYFFLEIVLLMFSKFIPIWINGIKMVRQMEKEMDEEYAKLMEELRKNQKNKDVETVENENLKIDEEVVVMDVDRNIDNGA